MGTNKEAFNTELYARGDALEMTLQGGQMGRGASRQQRDLPWTMIYIWANSQAAIKPLQNTDPGPGQWLARLIIGRTQ